jgi:two-component system, chemotaxis family, protein-glutamate methylesterase/glutaminase
VLGSSFSAHKQQKPLGHSLAIAIVIEGAFLHLALPAGGKERIMANRDIITIGASAGGVEALMSLVGGLPANLPASVFIVQHLSPEQRSLLVDLLSRSSVLDVEVAGDRKEFQRGRVYVAPPDHHLMIDRSFMYLTRGPRENRARPSVDPLFRSAAVVHGPHVVGVILTGALDDGTSGLWAVKRCGGVAIVQDPDDARFPDMPRNAAENVDVDHSVPLSQMADLLAGLTKGAPGLSMPPWPELLMEVEVARTGAGSADFLDQIGDLAPLTCAECGGPLWEVRNDGIPRFRCREGHSYTGKTLLSELTGGVEQSLWVAVQTMDERVRILERLVAHDEEKGRTRGISAFQSRARETSEHADRLRQFLLTLNQQ